VRVPGSGGPSGKGAHRKARRLRLTGFFLSVRLSRQGRLNSVEKATDFSARIVGALATFDRDGKQMCSSLPPKLSRLVARKLSDCVCHDSNGWKLSANWEGMH